MHRTLKRLIVTSVRPSPRSGLTTREGRVQVHHRRPVRWLAGIVAVLGALAALPGKAEAITGCPGGDPQSGHCYALGYMGADVGGSPIWMNAVSTDLLVSCLGVPNRSTDFATYETWMGTNDNGAANTWVEEGMNAGVGIDGINHGFTWFWADMRSPVPSNYHEHYGPGASVNTWTNISFYWLGGGSWNVERGGSVIGQSAGVGDWAGDAETGSEITINQGNVFGESRNFRYEDPSSHWHPAPTKWYNGWNGNGWLTATGSNGTSGSFTEVISRNVCGNLASATTPRSAPVSTATAAARLTAIAMGAARANGDAHPSGMEFVATTRHNAQALLGQGVPQSNASYLIQLRGHFTGYDASVPPRHKLPTGDVMTLTVSAATGAVTDVSLTSSWANLRGLGHPTALR
jgi:hypothetical protein